MINTAADSVSLLEDINSIEDARSLYPVTDTCVYLDSAHYSQYSLETRRRLIGFIDEFTFTNRNLSLMNMKLADTLKSRCAELINAEVDQIIITGSTTHGLNIFANGIKLSKGDKVAYADSEFPAIVYPWMNQQKLRGIENVLIPSENGKIRSEDIEKVISDESVKVLTISSVEFLGFRNDLNEIGKLCRKYNCYFVVDSIQSIGACPVDVRESGIDFLSAGSQKWMMAPAGIGFAYISDRIRDEVNPTYVATSSIEYDFKNFLDYKLNFKKDGNAFENSTPNTLGMIGLISSVDLFLKLGVKNIFGHILGLQNMFIEQMKNTQFRIISDLSPVHRSNILLFSHNVNSRNEEVQKFLEEKNIFIALREGFLRLSAHLFNNENDIRTLTDTLKTFS
ncbi:MAG: aminotransferase class V-fold PLP-dependent enzyme [Bacteroidetes bacterium]|nr:aminotransferase class V-fold PLP-dependent enzyme [Bacteroidota bacterium]